jgi:proteasome lid subunit RPN8/RPN11
MSIQLGKEHITAIVQHGEAAYPFEGCGLLLGREEDGRKVVARVLPVENTRETEAKHNRYLIPPEAVIEAEQQAAQEGLDIIGFFHSHPDHPERPSDFDREHAWPWYSYLVTSVQQGRAVTTTVWTLSDDREAFTAEELIQTQ